ncbi:MAG: GFA family protein [Gammaproteobacteria bacterium]|nr:GFA family protein [Gammaproteobacteria bacterium]MBI5618011.1 GFA family protein [Gammaproteobacteria bacterium]
MRYTGGCLCGAIRYEVEGPLGALVYCHCGQCRKAQGTAFASSAPVPAAQFTLVAGAEHLKCHHATPAKGRYFCAECGSPIYSRLDGGDVLRLRAGSLDGPVPLVPAAHIFTADRANWFEITDTLPRHPGREPGR